MIYKGNPTIMLWNQSKTDPPLREKFGRCHAAARVHPPRPVRPPMSGRAQSKRDFSLPNDRFIAREAIYKEIFFINQCKCCVFCENPAKLFIASRHSYSGTQGVRNNHRNPLEVPTGDADGPGSKFVKIFRFIEICTGNHSKYMNH